MKMFSDCSGECCVCGCGHGCAAGHGDDDFYRATKEQIIYRLDNGEYRNDTNEMIKALKDWYDYDWIAEKLAEN